nr:hypothetical protein [uncultured Bacillus sp.]
MKPKAKKPFSCYVLISLQLFLGIGGLFGGGALILSPDGALLRMPLEILEPSPFQTYLIPGIILFAVIGVLPLFTAIFLITEKPLKTFDKLSIYRESSWSWNWSLYLGFILIIWIVVEVYMIRAIAFIHVFYAFLGLAIQAVTLLPSVKKHYS